MRKPFVMAAILSFVVPLSALAGWNSAFSDGSSRIEVISAQRKSPEIASKSTDSAAVWAYYGTAGEADHWNRELKEVFALAFDSSRVDPCHYKSDCEGPPSKFENERWVIRVLLKDLKNERRGGSQFYNVEGTYELFDYGKTIKTWEFAESLEVRAPVFGGLSSNDHKAAQGPLAHNTAIVMLESIWPEVLKRDQGSADTSTLPKVFIASFGGAASVDNVRNAVQDAFTLAVSESGTHTAITESDAKAMLSAAALQQMLGCDNEGCMANIGQLVGASQVIYGSVAVVGNDLQLTVSYIDSQSGRVMKRGRRTLPNKLGVIPGAAKSLFKELVR